MHRARHLRRLARRVVVVLTVMAAATAGSLALSTTASSAATDVPLRLSTAANRSGALDLGEARVAGNIYVFTGRPTGLDTVSFWVDDTTRSGTPRRVDGGAPYDLVGGTKQRARPFDTTRLSDGSHTVTIKATFGDRTVDTTTAQFTVANGQPAPEPAPAPTPTPTPTPTPSPTPTPAPTSPVFGPDSGRPFADSSPLNVAIGTNVRVDPNSAAIVSGMAGKGYAVAQVYADTPPVFNADASTPRYTVNCTEAWGTCDLERESVPIPAGATSSPGYDANMVVVDWSTRKTYEFWQYKGDRATTSWGSVCSLDGPGTGNGSTYPCRAGSTGAGLSRLAGVVRTYEFRQGRIDHALVGPTPNSCKSYRYPAVKSDGWSTASNCVPEGARVQLDPSVNCDTLAGPGWEKMVCRALQTYGWYNIDNGGHLGDPGFDIQFENPAGESDPYQGTGLYDYARVQNIPWTRLRVLESWNSFG